MASSIFKLRSLFQTLQHFSTTTTPLCNPNSLTLLKTEKNPERILQVCRQSASLTPDSHIVFSIAISKLAALKEFSTIRAFIHEILKNRPELLRNNKFIAHAIVCYGRCGLLKDAFDLFDQMSELGVAHNVKTLNALLFSCMLVNRFDEVKRVYLTFPLKYGVKMNADIYNTLIKAFGESGRWDLGFRLIDEMVRRRVKPNATTFGTLIAGLYKEERFEEVGKVLELMKEHGFPIGIGMCNTRIQCLCKLKRTDEAKELLNGLLLSGMKANSITYRNLVHGYCKEGKMDKAKDLFEEMVKNGFKPDSDCYFTLVSIMCKGGEFEEALKVCKQSMEKGWVPSFSTMKMLVVGLAKGLMVQEARELVGQMKERFPENAHMWGEVKEIMSKSEDA
ncbi:tetratricopeptide-like helical domain-containing protein [Artemisia annua]|uniref:Tetratricopeptide-like helical domain-containing protein n=1 Tax=Artemisia annua TaxID=35608 RepID=A0A2U1KTP1_ARTAN|nr:tetratricopeptide-like helical domain-containing protein [Artemisia annua]